MTFKGYAEMAHWLVTLRFLKIFSILTLKKTLKLEVFTLSLTINLNGFEGFLAYCTFKLPPHGAWGDTGTQCW